MAGSGRKVWAADEVLAAADLQDYIQDQVVFVYNDASARTSGILAPTEGMVSYLKDTNLLYAYDGSSWVEIAPNVGTAGTYTKVTTDAKGRVTSGTTLSASDIPNLDASKITSGTLDDARIPTLAISKTSGLQSALDGKQTALGFTPIQQGGGAGQGNSKVYIGWKGGSLGCQVDATDVGDIALKGRAVDFANIISISTYNTNVAYSAYRALWVNQDGTFGHTASSKTVKQDIKATSLDSDAILDIEIVDFRYIDAVKKFGDSANVEIGVIAEQLISCGLEKFVFFNDDGSPAGVHYEKLAIAIIPQLQKQAKQIVDIEARLSKLEK